ncbi:ABC transporter ATP-binding protein [Curtobacterium sp. GD1]|uniref:ABC transporter ATP-binding protein n=1 Tax=Curtobacterium sp. GD1 TaxID=2810612 RepID=UPI001E2AD305|nr:ABC transporter ATP-binding protein [Curtobacterium sp. GD1]MCC8907740.1 ABC transporter ATP-binding protein [Curtobacterium sp. GD1]
MDTSTTPGIEFRNVTVAGNGGAVILDDFTLTAGRGEVVALLGPSGAGKTTALRAVAGFVAPTRGSIHLGGKDVTGLPPRRRGLGMVVQSYALFPHMSIADNVGYGLRAKGIPRRDVRPRVAEALEMVGMAAFADRLPRTLSGGQQQRVAIARALAPRPEVLLFDEPLSALDQQLRQGMMAELARLHRELPDVTMLYVTHGQNEALTLADRIAVMADSRLVEFGTAAELYRRPEAEFTARFLGASNVLPCTALRSGEAAMTAAPGQVLTVPAGAERGTAVSVSVRPHRVRVLTATEGATNVLPLEVDDIQWRGATHLISGTVHGEPFSVETLELRDLPTIGQTIGVGFEPIDVTILGGAAAGAPSIAGGSTARPALRVDVAAQPAGMIS